MGRTTNWIRNLLIGKKDRQKEKGKTESNQIQTSSKASENPTGSVSIPSATSKEKRRWSFRRSSVTSPAQKEVGSTTTESTSTTPTRGREAVNLDVEEEQKKYALAVSAATAAAADAAVTAAYAAAAVIRISCTASERSSALEDAAAIKIQSIFRAYLARKALNALKGLVKLQALVRGHLVRKQATATLRCMQALITAQARARVQRLRISEDAKSSNHMQMAQPHRKSTQDNRFRHSYHDGHIEENIKIVEMDIGESIGSLKDRSSSYSNNGQSEQRYSTYSAPHNQYSKQEYEQHISPAPSTITDMSPRACSGHFEDYSLGAEQSRPQCHSAFSRPDPSRLPLSCSDSMFYEYPLYRNYMANTESSRAKARSQSAPKSRPDSFERQPSRRRPSIEGRNVPRAVRMQRSSSHVGSTAQNYNYPWSMKRDRSTVSLNDSECGSSSTVLTNANYCRSLVGLNVHGSNY